MTIKNQLGRRGEIYCKIRKSSPPVKSRPDWSRPYNVAPRHWGMIRVIASTGNMGDSAQTAQPGTRTNRVTPTYNYIYNV